MDGNLVKVGIYGLLGLAAGSLFGFVNVMTDKSSAFARLSESVSGIETIQAYTDMCEKLLFIHDNFARYDEKEFVAAVRRLDALGAFQQDATQNPGHAVMLYTRAQTIGKDAYDIFVKLYNMAKDQQHDQNQVIQFGNVLTTINQYIAERIVGIESKLPKIPRESVAATEEGEQEVQQEENGDGTLEKVELASNSMATEENPNP